MKGKCYYCKKEFTKAGILKHLSSCKSVLEFTGADKVKDGKSQENFILSISPFYGSTDYWLYILINKSASLKELDQFLRDVWMECCGHLSSFEIGGQSFDSDEDFSWGWGKSSGSMNSKLKDVVALKDSISYSYDFGSTTRLKINVAGELITGRRKKKIEIMARNNRPVFSCSQCGEDAEYIDAEYEEYLCSNCLGDRYEMIMELGESNSPRTGVCSYLGSAEDEDAYLPEPVKTSGKVIPLKAEPSKDVKPSLSSKEAKAFADVLSGFDEMIENTKKRQENKKWRMLDDNLSLEYLLSRLTKDDLLGIAKHLNIAGVSSLKKDELSSQIRESFEYSAKWAIRSMDTERFLFLLDIARKGGCRKWNEATEWKYSYFEEKGFLFTGSMGEERVAVIPRELQNIVLEMDNSIFRKYLDENTELIKLFWGMCYYYGVMTLEAFYSLVSKYIDFNLSVKNLSGLLYDGARYYDEFHFDGYLGSDLLVHDPWYILREQMKRHDLKYFPLKKEELLRASDPDFIDSSPPVKRLLSFLVSHYDIREDEADDLIFELTDNIKNDNPTQELLPGFLENFDVRNAREANAITEEIVVFSNNLRLWVLKGHTPQELHRASTLVPLEEKVGRNEPCPCGSGKKYKKCCGK